MSKREQYEGQRARNNNLEIRRDKVFVSDDPASRYVFRYYSGDQNDDAKGAEKWQEPLSCFQCEHRTKNVQCKRRSCITLPLCWQHLKSDYNLRIGRTTLTGPDGVRLPFKGLFACESGNDDDDDEAPVFSYNDIIAPYVSRIVDQNYLDARYPGEEVGPYTMTTTPIKPRNRPRPKVVLLDAAGKRGVASIANTCREGDNNGCEINADIFDSLRPGMMPNLVATKDIFNGDEIFTDYGESYYEDESRHNIHETTPQSRYNRVEYKTCR